MAKRTSRQNVLSFEQHSFEQNGAYKRRNSPTSDPHKNPWNLRADDDEDRRHESGQKYVRNIKPRSKGQEQLFEALRNHSLTLALGPAGSGKTYLAITAAVEAFEQNKIERIILTRPAVEAGETLGFLPGNLQEKMDPYLRPLYDILTERMGAKRVKKMLMEGDIEIAPVAFMRGRTLNNAFIVIDEAQNCTYQQLKMLLTRLGWNSTMVITGDPDQSDLLKGLSGLADVAARLEKSPRIGVVRLKEIDIVRHPLVAEMIDML